MQMTLYSSARIIIRLLYTTYYDLTYHQYLAFDRSALVSIPVALLHKLRQLGFQVSHLHPSLLPIFT